MRTVFALLVCLLLVPCVGCLGRKEDPRDRPDFVDDTDPSMAVDAVGAPPGSEGAQQQPADTPETEQ